MQLLALQSEVNLHSNKSLVYQEGFLKNNSPYYNGGLSPFYTKTTAVESSVEALTEDITFNRATGELIEGNEVLYTFTGAPIKKETIKDKSIIFYSENQNQKVTIIKKGLIFTYRVEENGDIKETTKDFGTDPIYFTSAFLDTESATRSVYFYSIGEISNSTKISLVLYNPTTGGFNEKEFAIKEATNYNSVILYNETINRLVFVYDGLMYVTDRSLGSLTNIVNFTYTNEIPVDGSTVTLNPNFALFDGSFVTTATTYNEYDVGSGEPKIRIHPRGIITSLSGSTVTLTCQFYGFYITKRITGTTGKFTYTGHHARSVFATGAEFDGGSDSAMVYDSGDNELLICPGHILINNEKSSDWFGSRVIKDLYSVLSARVAVVISNGVVSAISFTNNRSNPPSSGAGTLATEWFSVDGTKPITTTRGSVSYTDSSGFVNIIRFWDEEQYIQEYEYQILANRYLIVKTINAVNSYDLVDKKPFITGLDYDNFIKPCFTVTTSDRWLFSAPTYNALYGSAINPFLEITKEIQTSIQKNAFVLSGVLDYEKNSISLKAIVGFQAYISDITLEVDLFLNTSSQATSALYLGTSVNEPMSLPSLEINPNYIGLPLPSYADGNILQNASFLSTFTNSYSNYDTVSDGSSGAPLFYSNNRLYLSYFLFSTFFDLETLFVLQGQAYAVTRNMLYLVDIQGSILSNVLPLVDISGFKYIGNNTQEALFYSESERSFYSFYGDRILSKARDCDSITEIYKTNYNPTTQTIIIHCNLGFLCVKGGESYIIDATETDSIAVTEQSFIINRVGEYEIYSQFDREDFGQTELELKTNFLGANEFTNTNFECWFMRFFNKDRKEGVIKFSEQGISDKLFDGKSKTLTIKETDWDDNNCLYVRFRPSIQNCVAVSVSVTCPFDLYSFGVAMGANSSDVLSRFNA